MKVSLISLGCAKNLVDSELMLGVLKENKIEYIPDIDKADVVIINTCGFIETAKNEAIENILEVVALKKEGKIKGIVVTGCLSERYKSETQKEFPEVDAFLGTGSYNQIVKAVLSAVQNENYLSFEEKEKHNIDGERVLSTPSYTAYLKLSEGCDNCCSYCAIPSIRGRFRSRTMESIVAEAKKLSENGVKELVLIAQDSTRYGQDLYGEYKIAPLLKELCKIDFEWIRLLYCYPERVTDELLEVIASEEKIVKYIEMPVQHASGKILKLMNRRGDKESLLALVKKIREKIPNVILRTTVIVGFPQETKKDFEELATFVKEAKFERLGAFTYSAEEGTPAYSLKGQIDEDVKTRRQEIIMEEQNAISAAFCEKQKGKTVKVLVEGHDKYIECFYGRSPMEAPEIDGKVFFKSKNAYNNGDFVAVTITETWDYDLYGETK